MARYRRHVTVQDEGGHRQLCQLQRRSLQPVVGDLVDWEPAQDEVGTVVKLHPRKSVLTRVSNRGRPEIVAANLSQLVVVLAPEPKPDWFVLDRYLCAAELMGAKSVILLNKVDLIGATPEPLGSYEAMGYSVQRVSALTHIGLDTLAGAMKAHRSVIVGQSGVGKSSLINALAGDALQTVRALSAKGAHGRHTTTTSVLYRLPDGGELIDSPGVRDYAPYIEDPRDIASGFREFAGHARRCRFDDCRHRAEPDCAVKAAVASGEIAARRYASYEKLYADTEALMEKL